MPAEDAELLLRLRIEALIEGLRELSVEEAMGSLAEVEAVAAALAATGALEVDVATTLVSDTVDALVVRGAPWIEAAAVDLDVRRLYDLAVGAPRPRLQGVVPIAAGALTSVDLWDDRAEVRIAGGPSLHLDAVARGDRRLELRDAGGDVVTVDLGRGRSATEGGTVRPAPTDPADYLARLEAHAAAAAHRDPSVESINLRRRCLVAVGEALGDAGLASRFDSAIAVVVEADAALTPTTVLEVVPVAVRTPAAWVLSIERWTDHWRAIALADGAALWTAFDGVGTRYGAELLDVDTLRFDRALPDDWSVVTMQCLRPDGGSVDLEVRR